MYVIGIDENGLGPKLGMFCVTAALFDCVSYDPVVFWRKVSDGAVDDSKKVMSFGSTEKGRRIAASYLGLLGAPPATDAEFIKKVNFRKNGPLGKDCPECGKVMCAPGHSPFCDTLSLPSATVLSSSLRKAGIRFAGVESFFMCPAEFNRGIDLYGSKLRLEFSILEKFFEKYAGLSEEGATLFLCGKLGGTKRYTPYFDRLRKHRILALSEGVDSFYEIQGLGRIEFIRDADSLHLPAALASVFGKLVREIFMESLNDYFCGFQKELSRVSGYNDPLTRDFIAKTAALREEKAVPAECFLRKR
jgi:ribonuclease HII